ncbi:hypothetical protein HMPREF2578_02695 [Staphylococcus sp. HMSC072H03]|uniref:hypothetical protein n=1 Tax=Staphylococcus sp. HMSC072H03 TaxID=1715057 RepID=UPI0008A10827|nr:hypothetical protein [Staphylococcus sp. HMSC072H03]OFN26039.1 hypothetical protein HMPREF2578_02695 [Staphylococcus sp. HMSC072H03]
MKLEELLLITQKPLIDYSKNKKFLEESRLFDFEERMNERKIPKILNNSDKYHLVEIANYDNLIIIDNDVINGNELIKVCQCIDFDSNIMSYLRNLIVKGEYESDFFKILTNIKKSKQQISCVPYLIENGNNIHSINKIVSYETILSFSIFDRISQFDFESRNFSRYFNDSEVILDTDDRYYHMLNIQDSNILQFQSIYLLVLMAFYIKNSSKKSAENKIFYLIQNFIKETENKLAYSELELSVIFDYINNDENNIFKSTNLNSKNLLSKLKGIAWDLFHIRTSEDQIALRNTNSKEVFLHSIFTADKGLSNVINNYSISRMLAYEEKLYVYRENNIFKKLSKDKASKIQELLGKDRDIRISNVREAKYSIKENIEMYEKYINKIISK